MIFETYTLDLYWRQIMRKRQKYHWNNDCWDLCWRWIDIRNAFQRELEDGTYTFDVLHRYPHKDHTVSLWSSRDMIALLYCKDKLYHYTKDYLSPLCVHTKGNGGLKKGVRETSEALPDYVYVFRSDIKGYYESVRFYPLMQTLHDLIPDKNFMHLLGKALYRTETYGGHYYTYDTKGIPMGSPLSPLIGALALTPLDHAMTAIPGVFYRRYMDDWVVLTKTKTALRKVIKLTHRILNHLQFTLHPTKTYIGKIEKGFHFLGYHFKPKSLLPSKESLRRSKNKIAVLYEDTCRGQKTKRYKTDQASSNYYVDEPPPTRDAFKEYLRFFHQKIKQAPNPAVKHVLQRYIKKWAHWIKIGLNDTHLSESVKQKLPELDALWQKNEGVAMNSWALAQ